MTTYTYSLSISDPEGKTRNFEVPIGISTIGRQSGNHLQLDHPRVSRQHAQLECTTSECHITDLDSSNGTYIDGEKITPQVPVLLTKETEIKIGPFQLAVAQTPIEPKVEPEVKKEPKEKTPPKKPSPIKPKPERERVAKKAAAPPSLPPILPPPQSGSEPFDDKIPPPGLSIHSHKLINYLPGIYHTDFMERFLGIFEAILTPIEWNIEHFDLFLQPGSSPVGFLPWLTKWFQIAFDSTWSEEQRRTFLKEAHEIYSRRGTKWALSRILEIYLGIEPEIDDTGKNLEPFTFLVTLPLKKSEVNHTLVESIIDTNKPGHTTYKLKYSP